MRWVIVICLALYQSVLAIEQISWDKPSNELLRHSVYPMDSTADAMVVQKETGFSINISGSSDPYIYIVSRKRIKIYM